MSASDAAPIARLEENLSKVIRGKEDSIRLVVLSLLAGGHVLLEDMPGTGKTTLAKAIARSISGDFRRIQFTPDLLPADITGSSFYRPTEGVFEFREGPIFGNVVLADEINRTSPRTQSALLEVMSEGQVTVEGYRRELPRPFFVIATQNPSEYHGTYPLPEAQLDRFACRVQLGYPSHDDERDMLYDQNFSHPLERISAVLDTHEILRMQAKVRDVKVDTAVAEYLLRLIDAIRVDPRLRLSLSPRASLMLYRMTQARAFALQRTDPTGTGYALAEDVRALAQYVLCHRLQLDTKAKYAGTTNADVVEDALDAVPVPR